MKWDQVGQVGHGYFHSRDKYSTLMCWLMLCRNCKVPQRRVHPHAGQYSHAGLLHEEPSSCGGTGGDLALVCLATLECLKIYIIFSCISFNKYSSQFGVKWSLALYHMFISIIIRLCIETKYMYFLSCCSCLR